MINNSGQVFFVSASVGGNGSNNTVTVTGTNSILRLSAGLVLGSNANSILNQLIVSNGASLFSGNITIGGAAGANSNTVTFTGAGSGWNTNGAVAGIIVRHRRLDR